MKAILFKKILDIPIIITKNSNEFTLLSLLLENFNDEIQEWLIECNNCKKM